MVEVTVTMSLFVVTSHASAVGSSVIVGGSTVIVGRSYVTTEGESSVMAGGEDTLIEIVVRFVSAVVVAFHPRSLLVLLLNRILVELAMVLVLPYDSMNVVPEVGSEGEAEVEALMPPEAASEMRLLDDVVVVVPGPNVNVVGLGTVVILPKPSTVYNCLDEDDDDDDNNEAALSKETEATVSCAAAISL